MTDISQIKDIELLRSAVILLAKENNLLKKQIASLQERLSQLDPSLAGPVQQELDFLKDLLRRREHALFGDSSERRPKDKSTKERPAQKGHGHTEQAQLRLVKRVHELPETERSCPACGGELVPMGDQTEDSEEITVVAREFVKLLHRRRKYRCSCNGHVATAPAPLKLQPGSRYSPAFAVEVAVSKYLDHLPLERQVRIMARQGLTVTSQTLWDQLNVLANHLKPTYERILAVILGAPVIHADETHWRLMEGDKVGENKRWWTWCVATPDLVGYRILDSRSKVAAKTLLGGYGGIVMADGYGAYSALCRDGLQIDACETGPPTTFRLVNCWAHARRKFVEAEANFPQCRQILDLIGELYEIERKASVAEGDARLALRAQLREAYSRKLVEQIYAWCDKQQALPRSGLGTAITYLRELKPGLTAFLDDPRIPLDNNAAERALRGVVVGRKNHYGSKSRRGAEVAALFYTLFESAKLAGVEPSAYVLAATMQALIEPGSVLLPTEFASMSKSVVPA